MRWVAGAMLRGTHDHYRRYSGLGAAAHGPHASAGAANVLCAISVCAWLLAVG